MGLLHMDCWCSSSSKPGNLHMVSPPFGSKYKLANFSALVPFRSSYLQRFTCVRRVYASKSSAKKTRKAREIQKVVKPQPIERPSDKHGELTDNSCTDDSVESISTMSFSDNVESRVSVNVASRSSVLQNCTITSGLIAALGIMIRQVSQFASTQGWHVVDCSTEVSFSFEVWHLELITGLVILVSSFRFLLLKTWPDFAESSDAANQLVLTSLQPLDYIVVAFLPGISEELLFRGALFPLFGINWISALTVSALFGILHLGGGRKYSFAIWATFVGLAYSYATILSSSVAVPMASHAINNLIGGVMWRLQTKSNESI